MLIYLWIWLKNLMPQRIHATVETFLLPVYRFLTPERIRIIGLALLVLLFVAGLTLVPHASVLACSGTGSCVCPGC